MGGTFPILIRGVTRDSSQLHGRVSRFYAINTLGAVVGTLAAGFLLLPTVGLRFTIVVAVLLNIIAGLVALRFARYFSKSSPATAIAIPQKSPPPKSPPSVAPLSPAVLLVTFAIVGATALAYEISWTRLLSTLLGSSTYAFTLMLATFLAGIVVGSAVFEKWSRSARPLTFATFSHTQTAIAVGALFFLLFFRQFPSLIPQLLRLTHHTFTGLLFAQFSICVLAMFPVAVIFGFNFPLVVALFVGNRHATIHSAQAVGRAYAANTSGAILAAFLVGFFLLPKIGSFRLVALTALVNLLLAIFLLSRIPARRFTTFVLPGAVLAAITFVGFSSYFYDQSLASFSAVLYGSYRQDRLTLEEIANTEDVVFFADGLNATISVTRSEDYVALKTNGKVDASTIDTSTQLLLGHLGAIFHPHPRRVLIIGFGGGMTASAVARYPDVESIDCVEIEPAVLRAAVHLQRLNRGVLQDPRLHLIYDDARNFIQTAQQPYDLIISEPSNPWIAGVATLYTKEFYATVRSHLAPGGMFVQWVQAYSLQPDDFRMILATLSPHFANLSLWRSADRDFLLLARTDSVPLTFARSRKLWNHSALQTDFHELHLTQPESWPVYFRLGDADVRSLAAGGRSNTDDRTLLEYNAPRAILYDPQAQSLNQLVEQHETALLPPGLPEADRNVALLASAESAAEMVSGRTRKYLQDVDGHGDSLLLNMLWGRVALLENRPQEAIQKFAATGSDSTNRYKSDYWLARAYLQAGQLSLANAHILAAIQRDPTDRASLQTSVDINRAARDWTSAVYFQQQLLAAQPQPAASDYCTLGDLQLRSGDRISAASAFLAGLALDSYSFLCHRDLGELQRAAGQNEEARMNLEFVVKHFPEADAKTYASLALAYRALGHTPDAENILGKGKRIFPEDAFLKNFKLPN